MSDRRPILTDEGDPVPSRFSLQRTWVRVTGLFGVALLIAVLVFCTLHFSKSPIKPDELTTVMHDCHPDQGVEEDQMRTNCQNRGCNWHDDVRGPDTPKCSYPIDYINYEFFNIDRDKHATEIVMRKTSRASGFSNDIQLIRVCVKGVSDDVVIVKIEETTASGSGEAKRWKPPLPQMDLRGDVINPKWSIDVNKNGDVWIYRNSTGTLIFHVDLKKVVFADQFIQVNVDVPSKSLYGFGERLGPHEKSVHDLKVNDRLRFPFFNFGQSKTTSSYGSHPFYLMYEEGTNDAHGVLLLNSNPSDVTFTTSPSLTYRTIGGDIDFTIFLGPDPVDVIRQKAKVIGHSPMPPYWALGFHLSRYGYTSVKEMRETVHANDAAGIPVEVQWGDIDYMDRFNMFTIDNTSFPDLPEYVRELQDGGRRFVPILDPAIAANEEEGTDAYAVYARGMEKDVFVKNESGLPYLTKIWNPISVIPDFTHANVCSWWADELRMFHEKIPFDGVWIDMNEPATRDYEGEFSTCDPKDSLNRPQYNPVYPAHLERNTLCMSAKHALGPHYNIHNMYSHFEALHTHFALSSIRNGSRQFILSRGSTTGQGKYSAHWTGDIDSSWDHMRKSVSSLMDFNLFGMPLVGADICGFLSNTTPELCARWSSLGAFYPFARNHNDLHNMPQDPASLGGDVVQAARESLAIRYHLLPYLYTLFYKNAVSGDPVIRSLKMNFPHDENVHAIDTQFMWGTGLLINPVLDENTNIIEPYFPAGIWYKHQTGEVISNSSQGQKVKINSSITEISVAMRGGEIIGVKREAALKTKDHMDSPFGVIVALDENGEAAGQLYWDDEDGEGTIANNEYYLIDFSVTNRTFSSKVRAAYQNLKASLQVANVEIRVTGEPRYAYFIDNSGNMTFCTTFYRGDYQTLRIFLPKGTDLKKDFQVTWSER